MNYLQLCRETRSECTIAGEGPATVQNQRGWFGKVVGWVRDAYTEIQALPYDWNWLRAQNDFAVSVGSDQYDLPSVESWNRPDVRSFVDDNVWLIDANGQKNEIAVIPHNEFAREYREIVPGRPTVMTLTPWRRVMFNRVPDAPYTLRAEVRLTPEVLTLDEHVPAMPEEYHDIIVHRAVMKYARTSGDRALRLEARADYNAVLARLVIACAPAIDRKHNPIV